MLRPGGTGSPNLAQAPKFLIGSMVISLSGLVVIASQMTRGQVPQIFSPRTATASQYSGVQ